MVNFDAIDTAKETVNSLVSKRNAGPGHVKRATRARLKFAIRRYRELTAKLCTIAARAA